jgi:N-carbamoyl-D-amino-acid hydrolase
MARFVRVDTAQLGPNMISQRSILAPSGEAAAVRNSLEEQLIVHQCALDFGYPHEAAIFNCLDLRRIEHNKLVTERVGAMPPP